MYLRFFDCRCSDMKDPTPGVHVTPDVHVFVRTYLAKVNATYPVAFMCSGNSAPRRSQRSPRERQKLAAHLPQPLQRPPDVRHERVSGAVPAFDVAQEAGEGVVGRAPVAEGE